MKLKASVRSLEEIRDALIEFVSAHFVQVCLVAYAVPLVWYWIVGLEDGHALWRNQIGWVLTSYAANYFEQGPIRRGLLGTLLYPVSRDMLEAVVYATNVVLIALCVASLARLTRIAERSCEVDRRSVAAIRALFAASPFTVMYFAHAFGMLDLPNLMVLCACIVAVERKRTALAIALSVVAVLVHEAFVVYGAPLITALLVRRRSESDDLHGSKVSPFRARYRAAATYASVLAITSLAIICADSLDQAAPIALGSGQQAYDRGLFELSFGLSAMETMILLAVTATTYLWLFMVYWDNQAPIDLPFVAAMSPLALLAFGVDYARWCAIAFMVVLTLIALRIIRDGWRISSGQAAWLAALFLVPAGPIGIDYFFPVLRSALLAVLGTTS